MGNTSNELLAVAKPQLIRRNPMLAVANDNYLIDQLNILLALVINYTSGANNRGATHLAVAR